MSGYFRPEDWDDGGSKLNSALDRFVEFSKAYMKLKLTLFTRAYLYMHGMHDPNEFDKNLDQRQRDALERALFKPYLSTAVFVLKPRLKDALKGQDPPFRVVPDISTSTVMAGGGREWDECEKYQGWINWQLAQHIQWMAMLDPLLMDLLPYGTAIAKFDWYQRREPMWELQDGPGGQLRLGEKLAPEVEGLVTAEGGRMQASRLAEDRVRGQIVSPFHILPDPMGRSLHGIHDSRPVRGIAETGIATVEELVDAILADPVRGGWQIPAPSTKSASAPKALMAALGANKGDVGARKELRKIAREWLKTFEGRASELSDPLLRLQQLVKKAPAAGQNTNENGLLIPTLTFYGAGPDPWYIVRVGGDEGVGGTILCKRRGLDHPSLFAPIPYVFFTAKRMANELMGIGLIHLIAGLQREGNAWANMLMNAFVDGAKGFTLLDSGQGITIDKFDASPRRMVETVNRSGIPLGNMIHHTERQIPNVPGIMAVQNMIEDMVNRASSATDVLQGMTTPGDPARSAQLAAGQGSRRLDDDSGNVALQACEMGVIIDSLNKQHVLAGRSYREQGDGPPTAMSMRDITPDMVQRNYEVTFTANPVIVNEQQQLAGHIQFLTMHKDEPDFNAREGRLDHAKLLHKTNPPRFDVEPDTTAKMENNYFQKTGAFPWPAQEGDNHEEHDALHQKMEAWARNMPKDVSPLLLWQVALHRQSHAPYLGEQAAQGADMVPTTQVPKAPEPMMPQEMPYRGEPGMPATEPVPLPMPVKDAMAEMAPEPGAAQ